MKKSLWIVMLLLLGSSFGSAAFARPVYFSDGTVIDNAKKVWQSKGTVHVLVNRDTYLTFQPGEVDINNTFGRHKSRHHAKVAKRRKVHTATVHAPKAKENIVAAKHTADATPAAKNNAAPAKKFAEGADKAAVHGAAKKQAPAPNTPKDQAAAGKSEIAKQDRLPMPRKEQAKELQEKKPVNVTPPPTESATKPAEAKAPPQPKPPISQMLLLYVKSTSGQVTLLAIVMVLAGLYKYLGKRRAGAVAEPDAEPGG